MAERPTHYSLALARRICALIADGRSAISVFRRPSMPTSGMAWQWRQAHPEFERMYQEACRRRAMTARKAGVRDPGLAGGPSRYTDELAALVVSLVAEGWSLRQIAAREDTPCISTINNWLAEHDDFRRRYLIAWETHAQLVAEETIQIADGALSEGWPEGDRPVTAREALAFARLRIRARTAWVRKLAPKQMGPVDPGAPAGMSHEDWVLALDAEERAKTQDFAG